MPNRNPNSLKVQNIFFKFEVFMAVNANNNWNVTPCCPVISYYKTTWQTPEGTTLQNIFFSQVPTYRAKQVLSRNMLTFTYQPKVFSKMDYFQQVSCELHIQIFQQNIVFANKNVYLLKE
jgi:hypothetical protein